MKHYFRKTAAFALTGAMLISSIPLMSLAEEDITEVQDITAIADTGETAPSTDSDLPKDTTDNEINADVNTDTDKNTDTKTDTNTDTDSKDDNSSADESDNQPKSGFTERSKRYINEYTELFTNARTDFDLQEIYSLARSYSGDTDQKYKVEFTTRTSRYEKLVNVNGDKETIKNMVRFINDIYGMMQTEKGIRELADDTRVPKKSTSYSGKDAKVSGSNLLWGYFKIYDNYAVVVDSVFYLTNPESVINKITALADKYLPGTATTTQSEMEESKNSEDRNMSVDFENRKITYRNEKNNTSSGFKIYLADELSFEFVNDDGFEGSITDSAAKRGETVNCTMSAYKGGGLTYIFLKFSGSKGSRIIYTTVSGLSAGYGNSLLFDETSYLDGDVVVRNATCGPNGEQGEFTFSGKADEGDLIMKYKPNYNLKTAKTVNPDNITYTITDREKKNGGRVNLGEIFAVTNAEADEITGKNDKTDEEVKDENPKVETELEKQKKSLERADSLNSLGLLRGTEKGYELEKTFTREESVTILVRLLGDEAKLSAADYQPVFRDVPSDRWSYAYTMYCYDNGITKGTAEDEFSPEADVSADQFVTLVLRLLGYTDAAPETAFDMAQGIGLVGADDVKEYKSSGKFIRDDMVKVVYEALSVKTKQGGRLAENLNAKGVITDRELEKIFER